LRNAGNTIIAALLATAVLTTSASAADQYFYRHAQAGKKGPEGSIAAPPPTTTPPAAATASIGGNANGVEDVSFAFAPSFSLSGEGWEWGADATITVPSGFGFTHGSHTGSAQYTDTWTVPVADLRAGTVQMIPLPGIGDVDTEPAILATVVHADSGQTQTVSGQVNVHIDGVIDGPNLEWLYAEVHAQQDWFFTMPFVISSKDPDLSEWVQVRIEGLPPGSVLNYGYFTEQGDGSWFMDTNWDYAGLSAMEFLPPPGFVGTFAVTMHITTIEIGSGAQATETVSYNVHINP